MSLDVSLRLRLKNELSKEALKAERDLKSLDSAAKGLGKSAGARNLDREINTLGRSAKGSQTALRSLDREAKIIGNVSGSKKLDRDLQGVGREARNSSKAIRSLDREAKGLNALKTEAAKLQIVALGNAGTEASRKLRAMDRDASTAVRTRHSNIASLNEPTSLLDRTMGGLKGSAAGAMAAIGAFASVDAIITGMERLSTQARKLDRDVAAIAVTAEMRTPEATAKISKSNQRLSMRYGIDQSKVNDTRRSYAAAGYSLDDQEAVLDPTLKTAKAESGDPEAMSRAVIAAQQNLGIKPSEIPFALDMMAKGDKLGRFSVNAMAKDFPALASQYASTGRTGMPALSELVAISQVAMMASGSEDEAATNLRNFVSKVTSPDTVKNFKEKGVSLPALKAKSDKNGTPYAMDVVDEVMRLTKGDQFKIGELFGDQQAGLALAPLIKFRKEYLDILKQVREKSAGSVDEDYQFLKTTPQEKSDRRGAAIDAQDMQAGRIFGDVVEPIKEWFARTMIPGYREQEQSDERRTALGKVDLGGMRSRLDAMEKQYEAMPDKSGDLNALGLADQIGKLQAVLREAEDAQAPRPQLSDEPGSTGKIPVPTRRPDFDKDLSGAADSSMNSYNDKLNAGGDRAIGIAKDKAAEIEKAFNFTATPTIQPTFLPPAGAPAAPASAPIGKQSSIDTTNRVNVAQNFYGGGNPRLASIRAQREQNRAIRQASARSLSDTGYDLA